MVPFDANTPKDLGGIPSHVHYIRIETSALGMNLRVLDSVNSRGNFPPLLSFPGCVHWPWSLLSFAPS